ncbi:MAG: hypothetical protein M1514_02890 [Patescibacteria group bacterium]|nr:hypothetical protein [Patescibacteria group bacterium]
MTERKKTDTTPEQTLVSQTDFFVALDNSGKWYAITEAIKRIGGQVKKKFWAEMNFY